MLPRYERNLQALSAEESDSLGSMTVAVIGCGGLGGYLIEYLGRLGLGQILAADGDVFEETNLNRQLLSTVKNLGKSKAEAACERMALVNPLVKIVPLKYRIDYNNGPQLLSGANLILDAMDGVSSRLDLMKVAETLGIPMVHGAVAGWYGQVGTLFPGDNTLAEIYGQRIRGQNRGIESVLGNFSFGPAAVAAFQTAEALKVLLGRAGNLRHKLLILDFLRNEFDIVEFKPRGGS